MKVGYRYGGSKLGAYCFYIGILTLPLGIGLIFLYIFFKEVNKVYTEIELDAKNIQAFKEGTYITSHEFSKLIRQGKSLKAIKKHTNSWKNN